MKVCETIYSSSYETDNIGSGGYPELLCCSSDQLKAVSNMGLLRLIQVYLCTAVVVLCILNSSGSVVLIRFDEAPQARSRFSTAIFRYSVIRPNGSNACTNNTGCSIYCETKLVFEQLDGQTLIPCPADVIILRNLTVNQEHIFHLNITTKDGERNSSSYSWFIDTIPPTATIFSKQSYTNAEKVSIDVTFSEACTGNGGFKCLNMSNCDVTIDGPAQVDASSLRIIKRDIKYSLDIILSLESTYAHVVIKMANDFCTDLAENNFTRTPGSTFIVHLDRRPVQVDLWTSIQSYELEINGIPRTVIATNKVEDLTVFLDFSIPITGSIEQIQNALHVNSGNMIPIHSRSHGNRRFAFELKNISRTEIVTVELEAASVIARTGTPVSPVPPITFLYDCTQPGVWLSTSSPRVTKESNINVIIEFTKPVFGFEASKVEVKGGSPIRQVHAMLFRSIKLITLHIVKFEKLSRALYSLTVLAVSQNVSVIVAAGEVYDISGNLNLASNQLEVGHSIGTITTGGANTIFSDPSMNLHGMVGHLQVFVLCDWLSFNLPAEYSETVKGLRWLIPHEKLPWKSESSLTWPNHLHLAGARSGMKVSGSSNWFSSSKEFQHPTALNLTNFSNHLNHWLPFLTNYSNDNRLHPQQNMIMKNSAYGLPLDSNEYFTYFLRGEPFSASGVVKRLENYTGWQDLEMNLFWLGVEGGSLLIIHALTLIFVKWRTQVSAHGTLSIPRFELFLLILMLPCVSQSSAFVIRGGTTKGILTGALLLAIPAGLILSVCLFLTITIFSGSFAQYKEVKQIGTKEPWYMKLWHLFTGRPTTGKWFYREGLTSSFLPRFGILFENRKGPPFFVLLDQNDPNSIPKWIESGQNGVGRMRAVSSDDSTEDTKIPMLRRFLGSARSSYINLDLIRRAGLGILSGVHKSRGSGQSLIALTITVVQLLYLLTLKPYIARGVHVVESVSLLCEAGLFGLSISSSSSNPVSDSNLGYIMLAFLFLTFVSQIINQWYAMIKCLSKFSPPQKNSLKHGLKNATKGLLIPFLPRRHWSRVIPGSSKPKEGLSAVPPLSPETHFQRQDARAPHVGPLGSMSATVVPMLSPGSPGFSTNPVSGSTSAGTADHGQKTGGVKQPKGLTSEPKSEMKTLRELAKASFSGVAKYEEGSTSYGARVKGFPGKSSLDNIKPYPKSRI
ncbi:unnamed protein product [Ilex paraguariensis]|uniref:Transmembrane protein n=1 Tax=Ilex paraguariensis TaxID=185542 RepID=A0ABC8REY9_9AQUA